MPGPPQTGPEREARGGVGGGEEEGGRKRLMGIAPYWIQDIGYSFIDIYQCNRFSLSLSSYIYVVCLYAYINIIYIIYIYIYQYEHQLY